MLAAGMGKRLGKYTADNTKCMLSVGDKKLIERACEALYYSGITDFTIVAGYKGDNLKKYLNECDNSIVKKMNISFINNDIYDKTNNIYSLFLAKDELLKDDTILLESDLIYEKEMIKKIVDSKSKNVVAVAKYEHWMDGTVIKIGVDNNTISEFIEKKDFNFNDVDEYYKTVNIYKFSKEFSAKEFVPFLNAYILAYGENEYYELVLKIIAHLAKSKLKALDVSGLKWYEIDNATDYNIASCLFSEGEEKLKNYQKRYGGYWNFPGLIDYCYLVNPYYPPQGLLDKINYISKELITQYPSGQAVVSTNASVMFENLNEEYLCIGNGAAELINCLGKTLSGNMAVTSTVFNEYVRCFNKCKFDKIDLEKNDYKYDLNYLKQVLNRNDILCIVNPDNPTGTFISKDEMIGLLNEAKKLNKIIIFDESFIDFCEPSKKYSFLSNDILEDFDNLIVIKSISKSYGIPGFRLGILATSNKEIMRTIKNEISIWNINSFGEYYLQIASLYKKEYNVACERISTERERFINDLNSIDGLKVYPSEANYVMCKLNNYDSTKLAIALLENNIFIKDLKTKNAFLGKNYIRLAIRTEKENRLIVKTIKEILRKN